VPRTAIGLGSNLGDAAANVEAGILALAAFGRVEARSSLYRSAPWGEVAQPDFVNAAALLVTELTPRALLAALKACEGELGRVASYRWGPRSIDLDILTYGDLRIDEPDLTVPHARLFERAFALAPLAEIEPAFAAAYEALSPGDRASVQRIRS
jgi:2-amino-4-hydroxy-6-hydroxymethyldihydropteridine diphosphokinase